MSIIKTNGLVLFGEIAGVYSENHRKEMNTLYGKMYVTEMVYIYIYKP